MVQGQSSLSNITKGDANIDGKVNASDIVEIANKIIGKESVSFNFNNADFNNDNTINVADIVGIVDLIETPSQLEYDYCTFDDDGMEGILTDSGNYAILQYTPDSTGYLLISGSIEDSSYSCILFDSLGYITGFKTSDGRTFQAIYSPNEIWFLDIDGTIIAEIPYSHFAIEEKETEIRERTPRRESYTKSSLYNGLSILNTLGDYLKDYKRASSLDALNYLLKGIGNRYGDLIGKLIKAGFDPKNPLLWLDVIDTYNDICFFGNVSLTALEAIERDICSFTTPCKVEGLTYNTDVFRNMKYRYEELMDYSYTLKMSVQTASVPHNEKQSKQIKIERSGTYNDFNFNFKELQTLYDYEPSLTLDITMKKSSLGDEINRAIIYVPNKLSYEIIRKSCTIYGNANSLVTGTVNSNVKKVENIRTTSADIICGFSNVPNGAECVVVVTRSNSDIGLLFKGAPGISSQTVKATGLAMNTTYTATTYISYNGKKYIGTNSIDFKTNGPSGSVISIDKSTITLNSAVAICQFTGVESGMECGVIVKNQNQSLSFSANPQDGEQSISLAGLNPSTTYQCVAYIKSPMYYAEQGNIISFTTKSPSLAGTWNCSLTRSSNGDTEIWKVSLYEDGTGIAVNEASGGEFKATWSVGADGRANVGFSYIISSSSYYSYQTYGLVGKIDNIFNPSKIEGEGEYRIGNAIAESGPWDLKFIMTK